MSKGPTRNVGSGEEEEEKKKKRRKDTHLQTCPVAGFPSKHLNFLFLQKKHAMEICVPGVLLCFLLGPSPSRSTTLDAPSCMICNGECARIAFTSIRPEGRFIGEPSSS